MILTPVPENCVEPRTKNKFAIYRLAVAELILGIFEFSSGTYTAKRIGDYCWSFGVTSLAPGIWCGICAILCGISGILLKRNPSNSLYKANVTMTIISACMMVALVTISSMSAGLCTDVHAVAHVLNALAGVALLIICAKHLSHCTWICKMKKPMNRVVYRPTTSASSIDRTHYMPPANGQYVMVQQPVMVGQTYPSVPVIQAPIQPQPVLQTPVPVAMFQPMTSSPPQSQVPVDPTKEVQPFVSDYPTAEEDPMLPPYSSVDLEDQDSLKTPN